MDEKRKSEENDEANPFSFRNFIISHDTKCDDLHKYTEKKESESNATNENPYSFSTLYGKKCAKVIKKNNQKASKTNNNSKTSLGSVLPEIVLNDNSNHLENLETRLEMFQDEDISRVQCTKNCVCTEYDSSDALELPKRSDQTLPTDSLLSDLPDDIMQSKIDQRTKTLIISNDDEIITDGCKQDYVEQFVNELKTENYALKTDLQDFTKQTKEKNQRIAELEAEIIALQKKEAEETAALEDIIQKVEANLISTTERAVMAEKYAEGLNQEIKTLQKTVQMLTVQNQQLQINQNNSCMEEKIKYVSQQLGVSAKTAEQSLKHLLDGVDNLKLLSEILLSADKFTEIKNEELNTDTS